MEEVEELSVGWLGRSEKEEGENISSFRGEKKENWCMHE